MHCGRYAYIPSRVGKATQWTPDGCPKHPRPNTVLPVEPRDGRAVTLGGTYCHEYIRWQWWKPAWLWARRNVLWPFFRYERRIKLLSIAMRQASRANIKDSLADAARRGERRQLKEK